MESSSVRTLALLRGKVWKDGGKAGRLAGCVIRAAEEIEHFNKTGFNIYLQVNRGRGKKGQSGMIVVAALLILHNYYVWAITLPKKTTKSKGSFDFSPYIFHFLSSITPLLAAGTCAVGFSFLAGRVFTSGRKHCAVSAFRPFLTSEQWATPRASGETKSFAVWRLIVSALTEMGREAPQPAADTQLCHETRSHTQALTHSNTLALRARKNRTDFFNVYFYPSNTKTNSGFFALKNRHKRLKNSPFKSKYYKKINKYKFKVFFFLSWQFLHNILLLWRIVDEKNRNLAQLRTKSYFYGCLQMLLLAEIGLFL